MSESRKFVSFILIAITIVPQVFALRAYIRVRPYRSDLEGKSPEPIWKSLSYQWHKVRPSSYSPDGQAFLRRLWFWAILCHLTLLVDVVFILNGAR